MLREFLGKRASPSGKWIDSVVNRNLSVLMVEKMVNIISTLLENFLAEKDGARRGYAGFGELFAFVL